MSLARADQFSLPRFAEQDLIERKFSIPALLRKAGLPADFFRHEQVHATTAQFFALWRAIGQLAPGRAIGLEMAADERTERFLPTSMAALCSASFHDALQRIARYKRLTCPEEVRIHLSREEFSVESVFVETADAEPDALVDLTMSCILSVARRGTKGKVTPLRVELTRAVRHRHLLEAHFKCPVRFRSNHNALVFRRSDLNQPFVSRNDDVLAAITAPLESEVRERHTALDFRSHVTHALRRALAGRSPSLRCVASALGLSVRTLQRRLQAERLSFSQIVEETRREMALDHLERGSAELNQIAFFLGYENTNSFFRAFRRWQGVSPGEWRQRQRASVASGS